METTQEERDELRKQVDICGAIEQRLIHKVVNDADRLAAIERQVLWRTEDMPKDALGWEKFWNGTSQNPTCRWVISFGMFSGPAPDYRPDEPGPLFLPILDPPT